MDEKCIRLDYLITHSIKKAMAAIKIGFASIIVTLGISPAVHSSEFLLDKAADFYCISMKEMNPGEMTTYDRGLMEGMALGFVLGQYPEQADKLGEMDDKEINKVFYPLINRKCPGKSFQ
jgi:hypothetical protein